MERNVIVLMVVYAVLAALSLTLLVYNYTTKYVCECGVGRRVYSYGGLVLRLVFSLFPIVNFVCAFYMLVDPFGEWETWMDTRTGKECRRARLDAWMQRHGEVKSVKPKTEEP